MPENNSISDVIENLKSASRDMENLAGYMETKQNRDEASRRPPGARLLV